MSSAEKEQKRISRREFVKGAAVGAAGIAAAGALAGCTPEVVKETVEVPVEVIKEVPVEVVKEVEVKPWLPKKWDYEYDIVVIGGGGAGAATAIAATDLGAKCLILEKAPEEWQGGNTSVAGGEVYSHQDVPSAIAYLTALNGAYVLDPEHVRHWAEKMADNGNWMRNELDCEGLLGLEVTWRPWEEFPELPGVLNSGCWIVGPKGDDSGYGKQLWDLYHANIVKRNIEMWFESPAKHLIQDPITKEILGVIAEKQGATVYIKAKKAVALTCGGFQNNQRMFQDFLKQITGYGKGTPYNTGDGILMALEVNADMWHMASEAGPSLEFVAPEIGGFGLASSPGSRGNCIHVGADGTRFINEAERSRHGKVMRHGQWQSYPTPLPVHSIFDDTALKDRGALGPTARVTRGLGWKGIKAPYLWSADNSVEIAKGWIKKADTIRELATLIGKDPDILEDTVTRYNEFCATGVDLDFGRPEEYLLPIVTPPYYAMELFTTRFNTQGGPRRNRYNQILDTEGKPIPRLYGGGELGSPYAHQYNGGMNLGDSMAGGRTAAENAVALEPWD
jgi:succinate dehydrogenase/fumarate reductase flavoprotein subunit